MRESSPSRTLLVDLYELTMAAGYFDRGVDCRATFELFVRHLPPERTYLVASGVEDSLEYLENLRFSEADIRFLKSLPEFCTVSGEFFDYLRAFRFTGDVRGVPEGTLTFAGEPILQVTAPVAEAQIAETYLLSVINFETLVASKAARVVDAAAGRSVLEFGTRRAQGPEAGLRAARAAFLGGCVATSNVEAGRLYGIPVAGTAAHSWTQVFPSERESFEALLDVFPETGVLLIDTYDVHEGAETAATLGRKFPALRLDSGNLLEQSFAVRRVLDAHGLADVKIIASGDLNEYRIQKLVQAGAPIDSFGVGTELATSRDAPALNVVYKLVEIERQGRLEYKAKFSEDKAYSPGRKQVFRFLEKGKYHHDTIARAGENCSGASPLLQLLMQSGQRLRAPESSRQIRARALANLEQLPEIYHALRGAPAYPVRESDALRELLQQVRGQQVARPSASPAGSRS